MSATKIFQIITRLDKGGSADIVLQLSEELKKRSYDVRLVSGLTGDPTTDINKYSERTGINVKFIPSLRRDVSILNDLKTLYILVRLLLKEKPEIVHLHSSKAGFIGRIAARIAGVRCIVYSTHGHIFYGYFSKVKIWVFIQLEKLGACCGDIITTLTEREKADFCNLKIASEDKIIVVPNGLINIESYSGKGAGRLRAEIGIDKDTILLGWIGRFETIKGPDIFLKVCRRLKETSTENFGVVMVGDGTLFDDIKKQSESLGLNKFLHFTGYRSAIADIIKDIDILILTSRNEGFGMVVLQAMAAGKPVIAMDVGGVGELIEDGETGYLVPFDDIDSMVRYIQRLINNSKDREFLGANGYKAAQKYSFKEMVNKFEAIYGKISGSNSG